MNPALGSLLALHFAVLLFGFAGLFGKWIALSPLVIVLGRTAFAAATLAVWGLLTGRLIRPSLALAVNGVVLAVHWVSFFAAIQLADVATGLLGFASFPLFVLLLERWMVGRRWQQREAATAALVTLGLVMLVPGLDWRDRALQGLALGVVSGATFALLVIRSRGHVAVHPAVAIALWQNVFAALIIVPLLVALPAGLSAITPRELILLAALGVACTALAHTLFIASLRAVSAHTASVVSALEPVYGIALAALLLGEVPGIRTLAGALLILGAAVNASRRPLDRVV